MSSRRKRQPILTFSDQLGKIVADNTLDTPVEADSPVDAPPPPTTPEPEARPAGQPASPEAQDIPAPATKPSPAKPKRMTPRRSPASAAAPAKITVSVRVPIFHARLLDTVREDARTYRTSENRLIAVHVRRAVERLRDRIAADDLDDLKPSDDVERALTTYSTSLMMTSDELDAIAAHLDPRGYFGNSRNLATAIALLIEDT